MAYGAVDELNSCLGALAAAIPAQTSGLKNQVHRIQAELFQVGAWLATTPGAPEMARTIGRWTSLTCRHARQRAAMASPACATSKAWARSASS